LIQTLYRLGCIIVLAPFAFLMMTCSHLFAWLVDVVNIPVEIDGLLTAVLNSENNPEE